MTHSYRMMAATLTALLLTQPAAAAERFECLLEPMVVAQVGSPVQGVLGELLVDRSEFVDRHQPVAALQSRVEQANLEQAKARAAMRAEIAARKADLELAEHNMSRLEDLHSRQMIPTQQRDEAAAQLEIAMAALKQARENQRLYQHERQRAQELLEQRTIRSPVDGVVVEHTAFPGEFIYDNPVMTIAQIDPLRVEVVLPASKFGEFKPGDQAVVFPELGSTTPLTAEVQVVDRVLDTRSGTYGVRLTLPNPELTIPGGQKCYLEFNSKVTSKDVVASR
ncbi:MAG: efflux RND transporter periplasmic adaptor subunit [Pseudomonadota bacterium]